jgi:hypothetical protein
MTVYQTCRGCADEKRDCPVRTRVRDQLRGIGVTSIKWRCKDRIDIYPVGAPVWATTVPDTHNTEFDTEFDEDHQNCFKADFPGIVVGMKGSKALVYIANETLSADKHAFIGGPFCKIPLSRIKMREGVEPESVCKHCQRPSSAGHTEGYSCSPLRGTW